MRTLCRSVARSTLIFNSTILLFLSIHAVQARALEASLVWAAQLGSNEPDAYPDVALDGQGNIFIAGGTTGSLDGNYPNLYGDVFLAKYDAGGNIQWVRQDHTNEAAGYHSASNRDGHVYVAGTTDDAGRSDEGFISKYDANGNQLWSTRIGTVEQDNLYDVFADGVNSVYVTGATSGSFGAPKAPGRDGFVSKIRSDGKVEWTRQFGGGGAAVSKNVVADMLGNVYLSGYTHAAGPGNLDYDAFVAKFNAEGDYQWYHQIGTDGTETSEGLAIDGMGNVYVGGSTDRSFTGTNSPDGGAFIAKYGPNGDLAWLRQYHEGSNPHGMTTDQSGNLYVAGLGPLTIGTWFSKLDPTGNFVWQYLIGASPNAEVTSVTGAVIDDARDIFVSGTTSGNIAANNAGFADAYLLKLHETPEPSSLMLGACGLTLIAIRTSQFRRRSALP